ncbi:MAG TPA: glycosyltransferase family 9 protein [Vicinamibacterales bacterium]
MHRILIVRLGSLGDIVHALPVAAALRRTFPRARIDWLVSARHRELLDLVSVIDRRVVFGGSSGALDVVRYLRAERYDVALDLQGLLKSAVLARASGAARVIGFSRRHLREPFARPLYTEVQSADGTTHVIDKSLALVRAIGVHDPAVEFPIDEVPATTVDQVRQQLPVESGGRFVIINPGAAWPNKRWPPARLGAVAAAIRDRHGLPSVVLWGPGERDLATGVVEHARGAAVVAPETTMADLVALARAAQLFISGDTGPLHLAAAVGAPIVGIYGPTAAERNGPWAADDVTVSRTAVCACRELRQCRRDRCCLEGIEVDEVLDAVRRRLAA